MHAVSARRVYGEAIRGSPIGAVGKKYELSGDPNGTMAQGTWFFELGPSTGSTAPGAS